MARAPAAQSERHVRRPLKGNGTCAGRSEGRGAAAGPARALFACGDPLRLAAPVALVRGRAGDPWGVPASGASRRPVEPATRPLHPYPATALRPAGPTRPPRAASSLDPQGKVCFESTARRSAMPKARKKKSGVPLNPAEIVDLAKENPYLHRLIEDPTIRENAQRALDSARKAGDRLLSAKSPAKALIEDKKLQADVRATVEAIRDASTALAGSGRKARKKKSHLLRNTVLLAAAGGAAALAMSESLRGKVLDMLFGAEEEFQYTPPADTGSANPTPPVAAA